MSLKNSRAARVLSIALSVGLPLQSTALVAAELPFTKKAIWRNEAVRTPTEGRRLDLGCFAPEVVYAPALQVEAPTPSARESDADRARVAAEQDGRTDVSGTTWFVLGCLFPLPVVIAAYVHDPDPPASRVVGKSAEYTGVYNDAWRRQSKSKRTRNAWLGAAIGFTAAVLIISASSSE